MWSFWFFLANGVLLFRASRGLHRRFEGCTGTRTVTDRVKRPPSLDERLLGERSIPVTDRLVTDGFASFYTRSCTQAGRFAIPFSAISSGSSRRLDRCTPSGRCCQRQFGNLFSARSCYCFSSFLFDTSTSTSVVIWINRSPGSSGRSFG